MTRANRSWIAPVAVAGAAAIAVAVMGATVTEIGPWYRALAKPAWTPPDAAFGMIWTIVFTTTALAAVAAWRGARDGRTAELLIGLFALNGFLNILWSLLFFRAHRPDWALIEVGFLWASIVVLMAVAARGSRAAVLLLLPYLVWVSVAAALNWQVVQLNPSFG